MHSSSSPGSTGPASSSGQFHTEGFVERLVSNGVSKPFLRAAQAAQQTFDKTTRTRSGGTGHGPYERSQGPEQSLEEDATYTQCEWMFGDCATGVIGINALAHLNPLRWSGAISLEQGITDLEEVLNSGSRPILVKVPPGVAAKQWRFETTPEAINYLKSFRDSPILNNDQTGQRAVAAFQAACCTGAFVAGQFFQHLAVDVLSVRKQFSALISQGEWDDWELKFKNHLGLLNPADLHSYKVIENSEANKYRHYRLGITFEGMVRVFELIGFLKRKASANGRATPEEWSNEGWEYNTAYCRDEESAWLDYDDRFGRIEPGGIHQLKHVFGYDACFYIRRWLNKHGFKDRSLLEVVLTHDDPDWKALREHVGIASVFWSHLQVEPLIGEGSTLCSMAAWLRDAQLRQSKAGSNPHLWCDYVSLRQCQGDFKSEAVIECVHEAGTVVACIDKDLDYPKRSFCLMESFAAIVGNCEYYCFPKVPKGAFTPISSKKAQTRNIAHKKQIDRFIERTIGFDRLDELMTVAMTTD